MEFHELIVTSAFPYIGEKIFNFLDFESLLNCTSVCLSWKIFIENNEKWWLRSLKEVKRYFTEQNMDQSSLKSWIHILNNVNNTMEDIKEVLIIIKCSNDHAKSEFWNSGPKSAQSSLNFLQKRILRRERNRFLQFRNPVDVPVLTKNRNHLETLWNLQRFTIL